MPKSSHEFRDPVHAFIRVDPDERRIVDSPAVQRLRYVHQLSLSYMVYPGATHRRFEHSLGVMDLAGRVFDVITASENLPDQARVEFAEQLTAAQRPYWRRVVRVAALCHDIGHIPFSHGAEHSLLPEGHESLTRRLIEEGVVPLAEMTPPARVTDVVKLAVGQKGVASEMLLTPWERILAEVIVGDAFGVDRMDYLLRDSLHLGVAYGRFDQHRLVDSLRILPTPLEDGKSGDLTIGIDIGGLNAAEALLLARYFMFSQVYFHPIRGIYDRHLADFYRESMFPNRYHTDLQDHLSTTDDDVLVAMRQAARDPAAPGHEAACCIIERRHFKRVWTRRRADRAGSAKIIEAALEAEFPGKVRRVAQIKSGGLTEDFPVRLEDMTVRMASQESDVLEKLPDVNVESLYVHPEYRDTAAQWLKQSKIRGLDDEIQGGHIDGET